MADSVVSIISRYDEGAEYQNFMNTRNINVHFLVAPLLKDFKFGKSLKIKYFKDFLFPQAPTFSAKQKSNIKKK